MEHLEKLFNSLSDARQVIKTNSTDTNIEDLTNFHNDTARYIRTLDTSEQGDKKAELRKVLNEVKGRIKVESGLTVKKRPVAKGVHSYETIAPPPKMPKTGPHVGHPPPSFDEEEHKKHNQAACRAELSVLIDKYDHHIVANALVDILKDM
jgi:hypothetical protein